MTTVSFVEKKCFVCSKADRYAHIGIFPSMEGKQRDLDGRAITTHRSAIYLLLQKCPHCGYCAPDIAQGDPVFRDLTGDSEYAKQRDDRRFPETANNFLCRALLEERRHQYNRAGMATLYAAWICDDDVTFSAGAVICRKKALDYFQKARFEHQSIQEEQEEEGILIVECLRRSALFDEALAVCKAEKKKTRQRHFKTLLDFQKILIKKEDTSRHARSEVSDDFA